MVEPASDEDDVPPTDLGEANSYLDDPDLDPRLEEDEDDRDSDMLSPESSPHDPYQHDYDFEGGGCV